MLWEVSGWGKRHDLAWGDVRLTDQLIYIDTKLFDTDHITKIILKLIKEELLRLIKSRTYISIEKAHNLNNHIADVLTGAIQPVAVVLPQGDTIKVQELQLHAYTIFAIGEYAEGNEISVNI